MTKEEITNWCKEFASGFDWSINEGGWLIVDPMSGFLQQMGVDHKLMAIEERGNQPQILVLVFPDGSKFIPQGKDLIGVKGAKNWMWTK